jgi:hypothetical protein
MSAVHVGASEQWSPREELAAAGLSPELRLPTEREASTVLRADLDAVQDRLASALAGLVDRALARLERAGVSR